MKLPNFTYHPARSMAEAVDLLNADPDESRVMAGGQSLIPMMALRLATPASIIDVSACADLQTFHLGPNELIVSASVPVRRIERAPEVMSKHPLLVSALRHVGHPEIRNRGTLCGSVAHADPAGEMPAVLLATDGSVRVVGDSGRRRVRAADFFTGPYMTALEPGEIVAGVEIPSLSPTTGWAIREMARRHGDFALAGAVCLIRLGSAPDQCLDASITVFGLAGVPTRCHDAESHLREHGLDESSIDHAGRLAIDGLTILGDLHGSSSFRTHVGMVVARRALREAVDMARQNTRQGNGHDG